MYCTCAPSSPDCCAYCQRAGLAMLGRFNLEKVSANRSALEALHIPVHQKYDGPSIAAKADVQKRLSMPAGRGVEGLRWFEMGGLVKETAVATNAHLENKL